MAPDRLHELTADRIERIERGHRLLEDHADAAAAYAVQLNACRAPAGCCRDSRRRPMPARWRREAAWRPSWSGSCPNRIRRRPPPSLPRRHGADALHGLDDAIERIEADPEVFDRENGLLVLHLSGPWGPARRAARRRRSSAQRAWNEKDAGKQQHPVRSTDVLGARRNQHAPARHRLLHAEAEEGEKALEDDDLRQPAASCRSPRRRGVRHDVALEDAPARDAQRLAACTYSCRRMESA